MGLVVAWGAVMALLLAANGQPPPPLSLTDSTTLPLVPSYVFCTSVLRNSNTNTDDTNGHSQSLSLTNSLHSEFPSLVLNFDLRFMFCSSLKEYLAWLQDVHSGGIGPEIGLTRNKLN